jgi:hypothetical protein
MGSTQIHGITYPVDTFKVVDVIEDYNKDDSAMLAERPNVNIEADVESMDAAEKDKAMKALNDMLGRLESD